MKKLISEQEKKKKEKRNHTIVGIVLVGLMVISTIGFALQTSPQNDNFDSENSRKFSYNGFEFVYSNGFWIVGNFAFRYTPSEVSDLGENLRDATYYQGIPLYLYSENADAEYEIKMNLRQVAERVQSACPEGIGFECDINAPLKTCEDNFIIIQNSTISEIRQEENCVYIKGADEELIKLADEFLFKVLKIKE